MVSDIKISKFAQDYLNSTGRRAKRISELLKQKLQLDALIREAKGVDERKDVATQLLVLIGDDEVPNTLRYYLSKFLIILRKVQEMDATYFQKGENNEWNSKLRNVRNLTKDLTDFYDKLHVELALQAQALHEVGTDNEEGINHYYEGVRQEMTLRNGVVTTFQKYVKQLLDEIAYQEQQVSNLLSDDSMRKSEEHMEKHPELYYTEKQKAADIQNITSGAWKFGGMCMGVAAALLAVSAMPVASAPVSFFTGISGIGSAIIGLFGMIERFNEVSLIKRGINREWAAELSARMRDNFDRAFPLF